MMSVNNPIPTMVIFGPTASGKSRLAMHLGKLLKTEIVESNKEKTNKTKFEIFKPSTDKTKVHNPKIIISDITKETGKKLK